MIFSEILGRVELNHSISMEIWPNPHKISACDGETIQNEYICIGRGTLHHEFHGEQS